MRRLPYIVVVKVNVRIQMIIRKGLEWKPPRLRATEVAKMVYQGVHRRRARRTKLLFSFWSFFRTVQA